MDDYMVYCYLLDRLVEEKLINQHISDEVKNVLLTNANNEKDKEAA